VNEKEALNLVGLVLANFPNMQEKDMRPTAALWCKMLADVPYQTAEQALLYVLSTAKFFPTIAEIREAVVKITTPELPAPMEAWAIGRRIAKKYSPARMMEGDYEKAKNETPPLIWRVIGYIGWRDFCFYGDDYMRNRFVKAYEIEVKREQERMRLGGLIQLPEPERRLKAIDGGKK
jgi:hypothetical protein